MRKQNASLFFDRTLNGGFWRQLGLFVLLILVVLFIFGLLSRLLCIPLSRADSGDQMGRIWNLIYFFSDDGSQIDAVEQNRIFVYIVSMFGSILLSGVLISTISNIFERRVETAEKGLVRYKLSDHVIIVGDCDITAVVIRQICENPLYKDSLVLLQTHHDTEEVRMSMFTMVPDWMQNRIIFYHAKRNSREEVALLRPQFAREVFILGEDDHEDNDSLNMECITEIAKICEIKNRNRLKCNVIFKHSSTITGFQRTDLASEIKQVLEFNPIYYYEIFTRLVLVHNQINNGALCYPPLDRVAITKNSSHFVHMIIVGMTDMGIALAEQTAHIAHYPNFEKKKTRITFIDPCAEEQMQRFRSRFSTLFDVANSFYWDSSVDNEGFCPLKLNHQYDYLGDFVDIDFYFVKGTIHQPVVRSQIEQWLEVTDALVTIAICDDKMGTAIADGMYLPRLVYDKGVPVLIHQKDSIATLRSMSLSNSSINKGTSSPYVNLFPFGMVTDGFHLESACQKWAERINFVYSWYFEMGEIPRALPSEAEWLEKWKPDWYNLIVAKQWSNIYHAYSIPTKLRSIGYKEGQPTIDESLVEILSQVEHNRWVVEELMMGYRPATQAEHDQVMQNPELKKELRNRFVHVDLCRYNHLLKDAQGNDVREYDRILIRCLPLILQ